MAQPVFLPSRSGGEELLNTDRRGDPALSRRSQRTGLQISGHVVTEARSLPSADTGFPAAFAQWIEANQEGESL